MLRKVINLFQDRDFLRHFHAITTWIFLIQIPIALVTPLKDSVPYLVFLSLWALVASHWAAWQGARAEEEAANGGSD